MPCTVLSFDVGVRHLAYCLMNSEGSIHAWNVINLVAEPEYDHVPCNLCQRVSKFQCKEEKYCLNHAKKVVKSGSKQWFVPGYKNLVLDQLKLLKPDYGSEKKAEIIAWLEDRMLKEIVVPKRKNVGEISLIEIGRSMTEALDKELNGLEFDSVLIENQISPIAARMKTLQGMLTEYFIIRFHAASIHYISSGNKLKKEDVASSTGSSTDKRTYKENKNLGIQRCRESLQEVDKRDKEGMNKGQVDSGIEDSDRWIQFFDEWPGKKDDLADSYLQGMWWLRKGHKRCGSIEKNNILS